MGFERTHLLITYLLVSTGFLVLFLSGEFTALYWALFAPLVGLSWRFGGTTRWASARLWNTVLVAALGGLIAVALSTGDWLRYAVYFASLMVVAKLYQRRDSADYFQLYVLSFLQLVAGAVINPTLSFAICFLMYVVLLTWALVMLHLRRDVERLAGDDQSERERAFRSPRMTRLVSGGFLAGTSALALGIFFCSIVVFLLFPRLGLGFFGQHRQTGQSVSGFNDEIELGGFGNLKEDQTIVMRVEVDGGAQRAVPLRLKGIAFDHYDGRRWSKSERRSWDLPGPKGNGFVPLKDPRWLARMPEQKVELVQRVYMEKLEIGRKTIFGVPHMVGVRDLKDDRYVFDYRKRTRFSVDAHGDVVYRTKNDSPLRYEVRSWVYPTPASLLRGAPEPNAEWVDEYLQLPDLDVRIKRLAEEITAGKTTHYDKATAINRYLLNNYRYSLEGGHDDEDPLADFLFGIKAGHCEYFSSAFVILARAVGVPARPAGGFYGGVYNSAGDYVAIRQADAHSWAEVYIPNFDWVVFDPTPPSGALVAADDGFWAQLGRYVDSLQLLWYKWVIRWDLDAQIEFLRSIGEKLKGLGDFLPSGKGGLGKAMGNLRDALTPGRIGGALGVILLVAFIWWRRRRRVAQSPEGRERERRKLSKDARAAQKLYHRLVRVAQRRGVEVTPATTPGRLLRDLRTSSPYAAEQAEPVVRLYERVVFGARPLDPDAVQDARRRLSALRRSG